MAFFSQQDPPPPSATQRHLLWRRSQTRQRASLWGQTGQLCTSLGPMHVSLWMSFLISSTQQRHTEIFAETVFFFFSPQIGDLWQPCNEQVYFFLTSSFVFNWGMYFVFETQCYCALNRLQSTVNIVLTGTGKPGNLWGLLCCDIRFSALVWNPTCSVSQLCLCSTFIHSVCVYPFIRSLSLCL